MLISKADQALLASHHVQIDIQDKCGLMTIQGRQYSITLLTPSGDGKIHPLTYQPKELTKEQMMNTASKVAIILLKKELLQNVSSEPLSFEIYQQGIKTADTLSEKIIDHEDPEIEKNTRLDYNALMDYLVPSSHVGTEELMDEKEAAIDENTVSEKDGISEDEASVDKTKASDEIPLEKEKETEPRKKGKVKKKKVDLYDVSRSTTKMSSTLKPFFQSNPFKKGFKTKKELIKRPLIRAKNIKTEKSLSKVRKMSLMPAKKTREKTSSLFLNIHQEILANSFSQSNFPLPLIAPPKQEGRDEILTDELLSTVNRDTETEISPITDDQIEQKQIVEETMIPITGNHDKSEELIVRKSKKKKEKMSTALVVRDESPTSRILVKNFPGLLGMKSPLIYPFIKRPLLSLPFEISPRIQMTKAMTRGFLPLINSKSMIAPAPQASALTLFPRNEEDFTRELLNGWKETQPDRREQIKTLTWDLSSIMGSNDQYQYLPLQNYSPPTMNRLIAPVNANQGNIPVGIGIFALITVAANLIKMIRRGIR